MEGEKKTKERELREGGEGIKKRVRVKKKGGKKRRINEHGEKKEKRDVEEREAFSS